MTEIKILIALLPIVFMFHDFEEIVMFNPWLQRNRNELNERFPKLAKFIEKEHYFDYTASTFAIAVFHEFLLIAIITFLSLWYDTYYWWFGAFMAYYLHLFVHIGQWVIFRKYVPVIITSVISLPYCFYTFHLFTSTTTMSYSQMLLWTLIGVTITILSFPSAFYFASKFDKWVKGKYNVNQTT
jgi:hypothetical protein